MVIADGQFEQVWEAGDALRPEPFPDHRSRAAWQGLAADLPEAAP